jgi:hypothetical protein
MLSKEKQNNNSVTVSSFYGRTKNGSRETCMALAPLSDLHKEQIQYLQGKITLKNMSKDVLTKQFISAPRKNNYWYRDGVSH